MLPRQGKAKQVHHHQAIIISNVKGTYLRKIRSKIWTVKWQQTHNYQQLNLKQKQKQTKQTTRTGTEPQKWRSHEGLSTGEWEGAGGGTGNK